MLPVHYMLYDNFLAPAPVVGAYGSGVSACPTVCRYVNTVHVVLLKGQSLSEQNLPAKRITML